MDRRQRHGAVGIPRLAASLLSLVILAVAPGAAYAADPEPDPSPVPAPRGPLAPPDDTSLDALSSATVDDSVEVFAGEIDMAWLQQAALDRLATLDAADYEGPSLALALEFDPQAAFRLVRDRIGFDPYRGLLRGGAGALAGRSGNSFDRAALLRQLLEQMGVPTRYAIAELSDEQAGHIVDRSFQPPVEPLPGTTRLTEAPLDQTSIARRAGRDYGRLRAALGDRVARIQSNDRDVALDDVRRHAWVQAFIGTGWVDLDPTEPDAQPGDRLAEPSLVVEEVPDEDVPRVSISVVADTYDGQAIVQTEVLSRALPAWQAADSQILLWFQPEVMGVGGAMLEALREAGSFVPHLAVAGVDQPGQPFPVRLGADIFSGETEDGPQTARLRLVVTVSVPGHEDIVRSRILLDRIPPDRPIPSDGRVTELELAPWEEGDAGPVDLLPIRHLMVSTGASSAWSQANDLVNVVSFLNETLLYPETLDAFDLYGRIWPVTVANQALVHGAERSTIAAIDAEQDVRAFVAEPRVTIVSFGGSADSPIVTTDLLHDRLAVLEDPGASPGAAARAELWYGALQAATETEFLRRLMAGFGGGDVTSTSTESDRRMTAFDDPADRALVGAPPSLLSAIEAGLFVVVPGEPSSATSWWTVDPIDGSTRSVDRSGLGWGVGAGGGRGGKPISTPSGDPNRFKYKPTGRTPTPTCTRANEYSTPIGCVSLPAAIAFWGLGGLTAVGFAWGATMLWQWAIGYGE
jgi:hypothetical protein